MQLPNEIFIPEIARLVAEGKQVVFTPTGVSMRPFIEGGVDNVTLVQPDALQVGDIVLAEIQPQHYVLHRIYALQDADGNYMFSQKTSSVRSIARAVRFSPRSSLSTHPKVATNPSPVHGSGDTCYAPADSG